MVTFVLFWAALIAGFFFAAGIIFKGLAAAFDALFISGEKILSVIFTGGAVSIGLTVLYSIIEGIIQEGFLSVLWDIILFFIIAGVILSFVGGFGVVILEFAYGAALIALGAISFILEGTAVLCDKVYYYFLRVIVDGMEKC